MNVTSFTGNLGRDFEMINANSGLTIAKNSLAVRRDFKNKQTGDYDTDWIPITAFGKTAETMERYLKRGSKIGITGSLQTSNYEDQQGNKRTGYDVIVERFEFLDSKQDNQSNKQEQQKKDENPFHNISESENPFEGKEDGTDISDDDLPF